MRTPSYDTPQQYNVKNSRCQTLINQCPYSIAAISEPQTDNTCKQGGDDGDLGTRFEVYSNGELGILDAAKGIDYQVKAPHLGDALQQGHIVELGDIGRCKPQEGIKETGNNDIEVEDSTKISLCTVFLTNEGSTEATVDEAA